MVTSCGFDPHSRYSEDPVKRVFFYALNRYFSDKIFPELMKSFRKNFRKITRELRGETFRFYKRKSVNLKEYYIQYKFKI